MKRLLAASALFALPALAQTSPSIDVPPAIEQHVDSLLSQLTPSEKLLLLGGDRSFYIQAIPRLGLPPVKMADGPLGVRNYGASTAYPATVGLAASFDPQLAREFGEALAADCRAKGVDILLAPAVNIQRIPQNGRNFEYLSEDPFLAASLAPEIILGLQTHGIVATVKHFAVNNQEYERMTVDAKVSERALREIYLPAFEAAVRRGHVWAVMDAYNLLNGDYCTANDWLNNELLKKEWGFNGVLMSDWSAAHDTLKDANAGLDLEMPSGKYMNEATLKPLIDSGKVTMATIDDKVRRILRLELANGFTGEHKDASSEESPAGALTARRIADESLVLLKNEGGLLPLARSGTIAVLGDYSGQYVSGGGSSRVRPETSVTVLEGLRKAAGTSVHVVPVGLSSQATLDQLLASAAYQGPLAHAHYTDQTKKKLLSESQDTAINRTWDSAATGVFYDEWKGSIQATTAGTYAFMVQAYGGIHVFLDDKEVLSEGNSIGEALSADLPLEAGSTHTLRVSYLHRWDVTLAGVKFAWGPAPDPFTPENAAILKGANAAILCVGFGARLEAEGFDRPFELPADQVELIRKAAALNPHIVVVLMAGGAVATDTWLPSTQALLDAWYPGEGGGASVASALFGDLNPSGRLPMTFGKAWKDYSASGTYPGDTKNVARYDDGILVGYRWFDAKGIEPLYPFGYGLSYTQFTFRRLQLSEGASTRPGVPRIATFEVTNTGSREGVEVAQLYIEPKDPKAPRPPRELKGFARVSLKPGETRSVSIDLPASAFRRWDETTHGWVVDPGRYLVKVGSSSRDLPLESGLTLP